MSAYADTSFLYSLYVQQVHSAVATAYMASKKAEPLTITTLSHFELCNAIRLSVYRKLLDRQMAAADLKLIEKDIDAGVLVLNPCDWPAVHAKAEEISSARTTSVGHRAMDLLHVAAAITLGVSDFLTFDRNQSKLASFCGLGVQP